MCASHWVATPKGAMKVKAGSAGRHGTLSLSEVHHGPVSSALSVGRRYSVHVGTRKMVNYA